MVAGAVGESARLAGARAAVVEAQC